MTVRISDRGLPVSRSANSTGASQEIMPANQGRRWLLIQAPQTAALWVNLRGGVAAANGADCFHLPAGGTYEAQTFVTASAVTVFCATAALMIAALEA